jgi:hypothetical protein
MTLEIPGSAIVTPYMRSASSMVFLLWVTIKSWALEATSRTMCEKRSTFASAVSRDWGDGDGSDMTGRVVAGWGIVDGVGFAVGQNGD